MLKGLLVPLSVQQWLMIWVPDPVFFRVPDPAFHNLLKI